MVSYDVPEVVPRKDYKAEFDRLCEVTGVNPVNHGEFEDAAQQLIDIAGRQDTAEKCPVLAVQRCRRGGKTFMLQAVASLLSKLEPQKHILLISLSNNTKIQSNEKAQEAILSRIYG